MALRPSSANLHPQQFRSVYTLLVIKTNLHQQPGDRVFFEESSNHLTAIQNTRTTPASFCGRFLYSGDLRESFWFCFNETWPDIKFGTWWVWHSRPFPLWSWLIFSLPSCCSPPQSSAISNSRCTPSLQSPGGHMLSAHTAPSAWNEAGQPVRTTVKSGAFWQCQQCEKAIKKVSSKKIKSTPNSTAVTADFHFLLYSFLSWPRLSQTRLTCITTPWFFPLSLQTTRDFRLYSFLYYLKFCTYFCDWKK